MYITKSKVSPCKPKILHGNPACGTNGLSQPWRVELVGKNPLVKGEEDHVQ